MMKTPVGAENWRVGRKPLLEQMKIQVSALTLDSYGAKLTNGVRRRFVFWNNRIIKALISEIITLSKGQGKNAASTTDD